MTLALIKTARFYLLFGLSFLFLFSACKDEATKDYQKAAGETMGTYYAITYYEKEGRNFKPAIDSLLVQVNQGVSTYIPTSTISRFNQAIDTFDLSDPNEATINEHFINNFQLAKEIYELSEGAFDPSVMPLVNYWGFGYSGKKPITAVDSLRIDSLKQMVGFDKVKLIEGTSRMVKLVPGLQLDMSACAKGYGVDQVALLLEDFGVQDYLVDIGGEIRVKGKNTKGEDWKIGINVPRENAELSEIQEAIPVTNISVATSGNYRNYYEVDGVKYSHTINPFTGFPERNTLLSASVFTDNCIRADAFATAFMVMGVEKALALAKQIDGMDAYFIYSDENGEMQVTYTEGIEKRLK